MSKPLVTKHTLIPPPIDGLNLISSPATIKISEARVLDNYLVYDSGIRQVGAPTLNYTGSAGPELGCMVPYFDDAGAEHALVCTDQAVFRWDSPTASSGTDITGGATINYGHWNSFLFNKRNFLFNGFNTPLVHDRGAGNVSAFSATGPTVTTLRQGTSYKHRMYLCQADTTIFWYGAVDAYSGVFTSYDLGTVFQKSGNLLCAFNWTFNQGLSSEEFLCFLSFSGELLIFSGDYPTSSNWGLVARALVPAYYAAATHEDHFQPFIKTANDVYLITTLGMLSLSSIIAAGTAGQTYYSKSRNIKNQITSLVSPALTGRAPFLFVVSSNKKDIYCFNYELSAWSKMVISSVIGSTLPLIESIAIFGDYLMVGTQYPKLYNIPISVAAGASTSLTYKWKTPFFDFGDAYQKNAKQLEVIGTNVDAAGNFVNTVSISADYTDPTTASTDSATTAVAANVTARQILAPPGTGRALSYVFSRSGIANEQNEIQGLAIFFETGGVL